MQIRCPGHPSGASVYPQGAKCHVRCRGGFWLKGAYTRRCVTGGRWSGEEPICLREATTDPPYNPGNRHHARTRSFRFGWQNGKNTADARRPRDLSRGRKIETFIGKNFDFTSASTSSMSLGHRFASRNCHPFRLADARDRAGEAGRKLSPEFREILPRYIPLIPLESRARPRHFPRFFASTSRAFSKPRKQGSP